jgi:hypothetical protein
MDKEETKKTGGEERKPEGDEMLSWFEFCKGKCKVDFKPEEMMEMFAGCCGDKAAQEKKGFNWQNMCGCMTPPEKADTRQK